MAILPAPNVDYTDKDFDSILLRLQNVVQSVFPEWTDFNRGNFGNILLECFSFVMDVVLFYQDAQARESRIVTATQRKALIALSKLIGFTPQGASAATVEEQFTLAEVPTADVVLPAGTIVSTLEITDAVEFQLLSDLTIAAATNPPIVLATVENSKTLLDSFISTNLANQQFELTESPYLDGSAIVTAANGSYTEVASFFDSDATDRHFTILVDENDVATLRFGNGTNGAIPQGTIEVTYKVGGGSAGNVDAGRLSRIQGAFTDINGTSVTVSVTNLSAASGGADRESNASIRQRAPETLRVLNRAVAREDFEIVSEAVAGVSRALMLTSNEDTAVAENTGSLYIIPDGGGTPSTTLKQAVTDQFVGTSAPFPATLTFTVNVLDPIYLTVDIVSRIFIRTGFAEATVAKTVRDNLAAFFALDAADGSKNTNIDFGFSFKDAQGVADGVMPLSDIFNVIRDSTGVRKMGDLPNDLTLNGLGRDLELELKEFPVLGTVTLINGDTGQNI